jgi:acyl-[acyl-carrier-protein]-phospholipid O-acyltransferase/long-chain-fatty-acid--[acyl-carrier-protein] ligase
LSNLLANIRQMLAVTDLTDCDRLFNCLPLFHSFGFTVGTFLPLVRGIYVFLR